MIDVVIPKSYKKEWGDHNELRYCLRSLERNVCDLRNVYIVGHKPDWLQKAIHIEAEDTLKANKDGNLINKVLLACNREDLTEKFIRMSDDQLVLDLMAFKMLQPVHVGDISQVDLRKNNRWTNRLNNTIQYLQQRGFSTLGFDYHFPQPCLKNEFKQIFEGTSYDIEHEGYIINTFYLNQSNQKVKEFPKNYKATFEKNHDLNLFDISNKLMYKNFLGYNHKGLTEQLKLWIEKEFQGKSKFEK